MQKHERVSLIYPAGTNRCMVQLEAGTDPNYYVGRVCEIWYGGTASTATTGLESIVEQRVITAILGDGLIALNSPLSYDLPPGDQAEMLVK